METRCLIISDDGMVRNAIVIDLSKEWRPNHGTVLPVEDAPLVNGMKPWIGWRRLDNNVWQSPQPFPSWSWTGTDWEAPVPKPEGEDFFWDEDAQEWIAE